MHRRKLIIALFGNCYQAKKSASIQEVLSCLKKYEAEVHIDRDYFDFLQHTAAAFLRILQPQRNSAFLSSPHPYYFPEFFIAARAYSHPQKFCLYSPDELIFAVKFAATN